MEKGKDRLESCVLRREGASTAPIKFRRRDREIATKEENMTSSSIKN